MKHTRITPTDPAIDAALAADEYGFVEQRIANVDLIAEAVQTTRTAEAAFDAMVANATKFDGSYEAAKRDFEAAISNARRKVA